VSLWAKISPLLGLSILPACFLQRYCQYPAQAFAVNFYALLVAQTLFMEYLNAGNIKKIWQKSLTQLQQFSSIP
jgi:hypothetical protein